MIEIVKAAIDPGQLIRSVIQPDCGAVATFFGTVRDNNEGHSVDRMEYHCYEEMAAAQLRKIERELLERWPVAGAVIVHRIGEMALGDISVGVVVAAGHRKEALEACAWAIERIKDRVPIWKKEFFGDKEEWVEGKPASAD